ncbi:hypothetical protein J1771_gp47 [Gordonia phage MelBins]|uniref:Uncharacterized protein n=1 Tax=Gordonia phage MelBins TaxID=2656540 RepID=A0A649VMZ5_9CAUD|nr:hypothetical protein J1771_gp47 [Gordonia phage MelBins]QGJ93601.1 hypothetical protein SEA_MELBINS_47 [Gordonia phage MelBins]
MASCSSCGERIVFGITANGKNMPLDEHPNLTKGNVRVLRREGPKMHVQALGDKNAAAARADGEHLYLPHFVNCPARDRHRKTRR